MVMSLKELAKLTQEKFSNKTSQFRLDNNVDLPTNNQMGQKLQIYLGKLLIIQMNILQLNIIFQKNNFQDTTYESLIGNFITHSII